jgi:hypothetical protein
MTMLDKYIDHCRNHSYMSGVERAKLRVKQNGEIFTPTELTIDSVDKLEERDYTLFKDPKKVFLADALTYHYRFDGTDPKTTEQELKLQKFI